MNEAETRAEHIDPALRTAGWGVVEGSRVRREFITPGRLQGAGQRGKPEIADYVLFYKNRKLAVIEAKRWGLTYTEGLPQAKQYAHKLGVRFTYATNGQRIYGVDMQSGKEGDVAAYPSPEELWKMTFAEANDWRDRFAEVPFEDRGGTWGSRYYQDIAVNNVLEAIAEGQQRILLTLATGTGKTFIAFQLAWKLFHARWNLSNRISSSVRAEPLEAQPDTLRQAQGERAGLVSIAGRAYYFWPTAIFLPIKHTTPSPHSPKMLWCALPRAIYARRGGCQRTAACSSPSSRRS